MPNVVSNMLVRQIDEALKDASGLVFVNFSGLTMVENEGLRNELAEHGVPLLMIRNNLAKLALKERGIAIPDEVLEGNTAMVWGTPEDAIVAAKVLTKPEVKKAGKVTLKAGMLDGVVLSASDAEALADVPDKDTLRAMLLGALSGPARGLVGVLAAVPGSVARVLQARVDAMPAEAAPAAAAPEPAPEAAPGPETTAGEEAAGD